MMDEIFNKWNDVKKSVNKKENKVDFEKINQKIARLFIPS